MKISFEKLDMLRCWYTRSQVSVREIFVFVFTFPNYCAICLLKERKSEFGRGFGAISNYWIEQMQ